jgi:thymidylate synthase
MGLGKDIKLYLPDKYKVIIGNSKSAVALCTCWTDPELVIKQNPKLMEELSLIGTLYSLEGISIMIRNLALNPHIRTVYLLSNNPLSKTELGKAGHKTLLNLWKDGLEEDSHKVKGANFALHPEIELETLLKVISNVEIKVINSVDEIDIEKCLDKDSCYMKSRSFPETVRDTTEAFPSEEVGWVVRGKSIYETWLQVVDRIMRYGSVKPTEYGNSQKELMRVTWVVENADLKKPFFPKDLPKDVADILGASKSSLKEYKNSLLTSKVPDGTAYTYGQRLLAYENNFDQVKAMIRKIKEASYSRRAIATTLIPPEDNEHTSPPCLTQVQVLVSAEGRLNLFAVFRSHDIFKAAISNAYGLLALQHFIAEECEYEVGKLSITSESAHIYEEEWNMAEKLLKCQLWFSASTSFDENADTDPRGNVVIRIENGEILARLLSIEGKELMSFSFKRARNIAMKLARLQLLSKMDHMVDITIELLKAEIALKNEREYAQDKLLRLDDFVIN